MDLPPAILKFKYINFNNRSLIGFYARTANRREFERVPGLVVADWAA
jgi:hypothetical protein